jgi:chemotaxis protein MotB
MFSVAQRNRGAINIWPGFVDALATLLLVFIFMLVVFLAAHFHLNDALSSRNTALSELKDRMTELIDTLARERQQSRTLKQTVAQLTEQLETAEAQRQKLQTQLAQTSARADRSQQAKGDLQTAYDEALLTIMANEKALKLRLQEIAGLQRDLKTLKALRDDLEQQLARLASKLEDTAAETVTERDRRQALEARLATTGEQALLARKEIEARDTRLQALVTRIADLQARLSEERKFNAKAQSRLLELDEVIVALREQTERLREELARSDAQRENQKQEITQLQTRLNLELVKKVQELNRYRSEFFGRLRDVLGNHPDIRIVGDRFSFQSELFFDSGSASLNEAGKRQLSRVAATLKEIIREIPADIDWILQINGHTDRRPINTPAFPSNWELSSARALSVLRFMIERDIPAERLTAAGFAEFQPIDSGDNEAAYSRNRRIEFKLTNR